MAKSIKELGTEQAQDIIETGCAALGSGCGGAAAKIREAAQFGSRAYTAAAEELDTSARVTKRDGESWYGIFDAPAGYDICRAAIDDPFAISGETTLNLRIERDNNNGLGFYAVVPKNRANRGHHIDAYFTIEFTPKGELQGCAPTNKVWLCRGPTCNIRSAF